MLTTNLDPFQYDIEHERKLAKWDAQHCRTELGKTYPRCALVAPTAVLAWFRLRRWLHRLWGSPLAYAIRFEFGGIVPRIRFQCASAPYFDTCRAQSYRVDAKGRHILDTRTQTRIRDMQALAAIHPWFGAADRWVHLQAWEAGASWAESSSRRSSKES
jgi:hypothetical protein